MVVLTLTSAFGRMLQTNLLHRTSYLHRFTIIYVTYSSTNVDDAYMIWINSVLITCYIFIISFSTKTYYFYVTKMMAVSLVDNRFIQFWGNKHKKTDDFRTSLFLKSVEKRALDIMFVIIEVTR